MGNFNRGGRDRGFGSRGSDRPMFSTTCSRCGKTCEVPFRPTGSKPVFCSQCFEDNGNVSDRSDNRRSSGRNDFGGDRRMFEATCDSCGSSCQLPFQPRSGKPVYCSKCFETKGGNDRGGRSSSPDQYKAQFDAINAKLDKIMAILAPTSPVKETPKEKVQKEEKKTEVVEPVKEEKKVEKKKAVKKVAVKKASKK